MDKETLSNYGWIVICVMILAVILALATPFGNFIAQGFKSIYEGFGLTSNNALGVIIPGANGPSGGSPEEPHEPNTLYYYQPYRFDYEDGYILEMVFHKDGTVDGYMSQNGDEYGEVSYEEDTIAVYGEGTVTFMEVEFAISEDGTRLTATGLPDDVFLPEGVLIPTKINKLQMDTPYRFAYSGGEDKIIFKSDGSAILNSYQDDELVSTMEIPANTISYFDEYYTMKHEYDDETFIERLAVYPDGDKIIFGGAIFNICCNHANTRIENETADMTGDKYCNDCGELLQGSKPKVEAYMLVLDNTSDANNSYPMIIVKSATEIKAGDTYNSKTYGNKKVLSVYDGIEYEVYKDIVRPFSLKPTPTEIIPWNSEGSRVTAIVVEDTIKPIATDYWFMDFTKCKTVDLAKLDTSKTVSMISMFQSSSIKDASSLTLSASILDVTAMFRSCYSIEKFPDFKNAPNITNMSYTFYYCGNITQIPDLSYNTKVVNMEYTFAGCSSLTQTPDLSKNINVESLKCAFGSCSNITVAPNLSTMTKLTDVSRLFEGCTNLQTGPKLPTSVVNLDSMFKNCKALTNTYPIVATNAISIREMCKGCTSLTEITINAPIKYIGHDYCETFGGKNDKQYTTVYGYDLLLTRIVNGSCAVANITTKEGLTKIEKPSGNIQATYEGTGRYSVVTVSEGVETIGDSTFANMTQLKEIHLPKTLKNIGAKAFYYTELTDIYFAGTLAEWKAITKGTDWAFLAHANMCRLHCSDSNTTIQ